ncbi:protein NPAT isoform X2 [Sphaerodactylus townsendi]|uniref:Uncharacterized protein n=1 Tax=Sphaerodactylus townsendi TaxID=933632 RepID=A0ACB8FFV9_9SAUR|nr:protein NPAT isoform X2 [Sphaerodactylus townsendi]
MLLPSDVARLVLGYLQQEKLLSTCRTFILESSDLKEYAEHCTGDGFVPACLLSLFGKNLTTILNEYIAMKTKETAHDVPAMMSSLWKKLDYTLSQIRSMQNSSAFSAHQRGRTRSAIADLKKQKCLQSSASSSLGPPCLVLQPGQLSSIPMTATQVILKPVATPNQAETSSGPASAHQPQAQGICINRDSLSLVSAAVQERKLHSSTMSPGKRKNDSQKKKAVSSGSQSSNSSSEDSPTVEEESSPMEEESEPLEGLIEGNFPQMVIQNAREKILRNKCLQEKLAENINKFLGSDGTVSQAPKQPESSLTIQESSIDEFLALQQGEIHMTEEAIQEILEQTESDPAFHGLFDMFDFGKTKGSKNASAGVFVQGGGEENAMLVDEENLQALESYIGTKAISDDPQERLSYTGDLPKEATCTLKEGGSDVILEEHLKMQSIIGGEFQGVSEVGTETHSDETRLHSQQLQHKMAFESEPDHVCASELNGNNSSSYPNPETTVCGLDPESETSLLPPGGQNFLELQYDQLDAQQKSLSERAECCSFPDNILSEKANAKPLSPLNSGHSEMLDGRNVADSHPLEESDKTVKQVAQESPLFSAASQQNPTSPTLSNLQDQNKLTLDSTTVPSVSSPDPAAAELQLEVVATSDSLHSEDQLVLEESCSKHPNQESADSETMLAEVQEPSSPTKPGADSLFLPSDNERQTETPVESNPATSAACCSPPPEPAGESSPGTKAAGSLSSGSQATDEDPSSIVSLKIIISDDPFISSDAELSNAVSSITGENLPTIILSSPAKSPTSGVGPARCLVTSEEIERTGDSGLVEQNLLIVRGQDSVVSTLNVQNEECAVFSVAGTCSVAKEGGFIQLMPGTTTSFGNCGNVYITTCVTEPTALSSNVTPSNLVMLPGGSTSLTSQVPAVQQLRTPPRTNSLFAMNPPLSPNFSQGSAIIIASPVQPVLQGMVGMIPVSIMGQSGNAFSDPSRQVLHMPVQTSLCGGGVPKLPLPPKSQKLPRSKLNAGKLKMDQNGSDPVNRRVQRIGNCANLRKKLEAVAVDTTSCNPKQSESHRRVLCFDSSPGGAGGSLPAPQKERNENASLSGDSLSGVPPSTKTQPSKRERERMLPRILCKPDITNRNATVREAQLERKALGPGLASDVLRKQTANKENELERGVDEISPNHEGTSLSNGPPSISLHIEKNCSPAQEPNKKQGLQLNANSKNSGVLTSKEAKKDQTKSHGQTHCLTSPLTKQAVEMLHDIQRQSPAAKLPENGDLPVPRTPSGTGDRHSEDTFDIIKTPTCKRYSEDSTTPRIMVPPATPDLPACSPASETSSENSVSMAAHTLMILSRAAIARTSTNTPLKDNSQQFRPLRSSAKKRKQEDTVECERNSWTASKKDLQNFTVPIKKKKVKQKKLPISFPAGMDVDKFLLSLHYDE